MKKVAAAFLLVLAMALVSPVQAQSDFDLNRDFDSQLVPVSYICQNALKSPLLQLWG